MFPTSTESRSLVYLYFEYRLNEASMWEIRSLALHGRASLACSTAEAALGPQRSVYVDPILGKFGGYTVINVTRVVAMGDFDADRPDACMVGRLMTSKAGLSFPQYQTSVVTTSMRISQELKVSPQLH